MYLLLVTCLALAVFLILNAVLRLSTEIVWRTFLPALLRFAPQTQARIFFFLGVFPTAAALTAILFLLLPAYFLFEPNVSDEEVGLKMAVLSVVSAAGGATAVYRGLKSFLVTRKLTANWLSTAQKIRLGDDSAQFYCFEHEFPVVAVVGLLRPKVFVANRVLNVLSEAELIAALAHERGHLAANDNLKRFLLNFCSDLLFFRRFGNPLRRLWADNAETVADEFAAGERGKQQNALCLASALIKIARLAPADLRAELFAGAFLVEESNGNIAARVVRLTGLQEKPNAVHFFKHNLLIYITACALTTATLVFASQAPLDTIHNLIERIVRVLE